MKLIKIITISFCIIMILSQNAFALENILDTGTDWVGTGRNYAGIGMNTTKLIDASGKLYNVLLAIATIAAIIVGAILGLQYMTAGIEKKVEVKESLFPYIVSCIVVFGSLGIWKLVVAIMSQLK